ncbi:MAG: S1 RNA-binding domain-containing protein, partial [Chitinophagaceae bacterium]
CSTTELIQQAALRKLINKKKYLSASVGEYTVDDIMKELEKPGRDPRQVIQEFRFDDSIKCIEDLKAGMTIPGLVTNITKFGAFVDIGVKQDGLVHISQLSNNYVSDPNEVVKLQQTVMVTITEVDVTRKRIALTMKENDKKADAPQIIKKNPPIKNARSVHLKKEEPVNSFQVKLDELKKRFK